VVRVARPGANGRFEKAALHPDARARIAATRAYIDQNWMRDDAPLMYAFNTGVGLFKDQRVLIAEMEAYQRKTVYAHATGVGESFGEDTTRAMMLLRANAFASNYSGPQVELVERLLAFVNAGLHPVIPQRGSVGASGDLAPLAHMAGAVCGFHEAEIVYKGRRMPAREAIAKAGFDPNFPLGAKDASALINGSTTSLALGALAVHDARKILKHARHRHVPLARGHARRARAFDPRLHSGAAPSGQAKVARNCCASWRARSAARRRRDIVFPDEPRQPGQKPPRGAGRLFPALHAPGARAGDRGGRIRRAHLGTEMNSATDNPLIFDDGAGRLRLDLGRHFPRASTWPRPWTFSPSP
jgi:histidine ammonia-lyase